MNIILFYETKSKYGCFTNFYKTSRPIKINKEYWITSEHYYQAMKFRGNNSTSRMLEYSNIIRDCDSPMKSKILGQQKKNTHYGSNWKLNKKDTRLVNDIVDEYKDLKMRDDWEVAGVAVMINILFYKFTQIEECNKIITSISDNSYIVEHTTRDKKWADGGDGGSGEIGQNILGKILTALSFVLKHKTIEEMNIEIKNKIKVFINIVDNKIKKTIISWNVNGIRSNILSNSPFPKQNGWSCIEESSNLAEIIKIYDPDILCFQETRCDKDIYDKIKINDYYQYWNASKGINARQGNRYSGTSIWSKTEPNSISFNIPTLLEPDMEGRIIIAEYDNFTIINTYCPNAGTNFEYRVNVWDKAIREYLKNKKSEGINIIWVGDINVAPDERDVFFRNPECSRYSKTKMLGVGADIISGFTKEERDNFKLCLDNGFCDVFRIRNPTLINSYSWFNMRIPTDRKNNLGMRIDNFIIPEYMLNNVIDCKILNDMGKCSEKISSDHIPILLSFYE